MYKFIFALIKTLSAQFLPTSNAVPSDFYSRASSRVNIYLKRLLKTLGTTAVPSRTIVESSWGPIQAPSVVMWLLNDATYRISASRGAEDVSECFSECVVCGMVGCRGCWVVGLFTQRVCRNSWITRLCEKCRRCVPSFDGSLKCDISSWDI